MQALRPDGSWVRLGSAEYCGLPPSMAGEHLPAVHLSDAHGWIASFVLQESLRDDAVAAVAALRALGVRTWLLSGDREAAAQQVARVVGVDHVIAGASPEQKLAEITALQA